MFGNIHICSVCMSRVTVDQLQGLSCGHMFCAECWDHYCQVQIQQGITTGRWRCPGNSLQKYSIAVYRDFFQL